MADYGCSGSGVYWVRRRTHGLLAAASGCGLRDPRKLSREEAVKEVALRYREFVDAFENARAK